MNCTQIGPIGICSWSLDNDLVLMNWLRDKVGLDRVHLSLNPVLDNQAGYVQSFTEAGWKISATMIGFGQEDYTTLDSIRLTGGIVPDAFWPQNRTRVIEAIEATAKLGVSYLEFHFGFIELTSLDYASKLMARAKELADIAHKNNIQLLLETGQETADTLRLFLERLDHPALGVNFDPANMILYGKGNPIEAVKTLGPWIRHVHVKDAIASAVPGQWGREVAWGAGQVNPNSFLKALKQAGFAGTLSIEREAGQSRLQDIESAVNQLAAWSDGDV